MRPLRSTRAQFRMATGWRFPQPAANMTSNFATASRLSAWSRHIKICRQKSPAGTFDRVKGAAGDRWNDVLGQIQIKGGTEDQKRVFYTSLYRCDERMVNISQDGQYYSAFDQQVHQDARPLLCG